MKEKTLEKLKVLKDLYDNEQIIIFVGAGVSKNSGAPDWNDFTSAIIEKLKLEDNEKKGFSFNQHILYAQYYWNKNPKAYDELLETIFNTSGLKPHFLHRKIMELNISDVITTNYDRLLEESHPYKAEQYEVINSDLEMLSATKKYKIIKMHGDIRNSEGIVLKESDYLNFEAKRKVIHNYLKHLFFSKSILFIGYALGDFNVKQIMNDIKEYSESLLDNVNNKLKKTNPYQHKRKHFFLTFNDNFFKKKKDREPTKENKYNVKYYEKMDVHTIDVAEDFTPKEEVEAIRQAIRQGKMTEEEAEEAKNKIKAGALYNFLDALETFSLNSLKGESLAKEIENRFELLNQQKYVSTNDIINMLDIRIRKNSTDRKLIILNEDVFNVLEKGSPIINEVFNKTLLSNVKYNSKEFSINNYENNYKKINERLQKIKLDNIEIELTMESFSMSGDSYERDEIINYFNRNSNTEKFFDIYTKQFNSVIINHHEGLVPNKEEEGGPKPNKEIIGAKIKYIKNSMDYNGKRQIAELEKIASLEYTKITDEFYKKAKIIKNEVNGLSVNIDSRDYMGEIAKLIQSLYLYPMLNSVASLFYRGNFKILVDETAECLLAPFNINYPSMRINSFFEGCNQFGGQALELIGIFFISDLIDTKDLLGIIYKNKVSTIKVNFETEVLYKFLNSYFEKLNSIQGKNNFTLSKRFSRNLLIFISLIDKVFPKKISQMRLPVDFLAEYLSFCNDKLKFRDINWEVDEKFYNDLFIHVLEKQSNLKWENFNKVFEHKINVLSEENIEKLRDIFLRCDINHDIPYWMFCFLEIIGKDQLLEKIVMKNINTKNLVQLIEKECVPFDNSIAYLIKEKKPKPNEKQWTCFTSNYYIWYELILKLAMYLKYSNIELFWNIFIDSNDKYTDIIHHFVNKGSLGEINKEIDFLEVQLMRKFLKEPKIRKKIKTNKIREELTYMNKQGLMTHDVYYLWEELNDN